MHKNVQTSSDFLTDIEARSRVAYINKNTNPEEKSEIELYIYTDDPGQIPHMHIHIQGQHDVCIRFDSPNYFSHEKNNNTVSSKVAAWIDAILRITDDDDQTLWKFAVKSWNSNNSGSKLPLDLEQPDYTKLNKQ